MLLARLIALVPHDSYIEAFVGMGGVFLRRTFRPDHEVINDRGADVANLFRVVAEHPGELARQLSRLRVGRLEFGRQLAITPEHLTDVQRAARFVYLQKLAFGGKVAGRSFGVDPVRSRFNPERLAIQVHELAERLSGVVIECLDFQELLERYDHPRALVFLDPPYWGSEGDYGAGLFGRADFERLAATLRGLKAPFIMTINDVPEVRAAFEGFDQHPVTLTYTISGGQTDARELIITTPGLVPQGINAVAATVPAWGGSGRQASLEL